MLDFYAISDQVPKPDWPEKINLKRIEGLEVNEFDDLISKKLIPKRFDYWTDFRWNKVSSLELYELTLKSYPELRENKLTIKSVNKFFNILETAVKNGVGLIAYSD